MVPEKKESFVIVRDKESVIVRSIKMKIQDKGLDLTVVDEDLDRLEQVSEKADAFIVYLGEITRDTIKALSFITDITRIRGRYLLVIGQKMQYADITSEIPSLKRSLWLDRPLDMDMFDKEINEILSDLRRKTQKKRILVVDDDPDYATMVRDWIKDDYQVFVVTAGTQAISFLMKQDVDLVLLDYEMPVADGPQILEMLRNDPRTASIPVVFLTGVRTKEAVNRVVSLKPDGYILKSTPKEELLDFLESRVLY